MVDHPEIEGREEGRAGGRCAHLRHVEPVEPLGPLNGGISVLYMVED